MVEVSPWARVGAEDVISRTRVRVAVAPAAVAVWAGAATGLGVETTARLLTVEKSCDASRSIRSAFRPPNRSPRRRHSSLREATFMDEYWVGVEDSRGLGLVLGVDWWMPRARGEARGLRLRVRAIRSIVVMRVVGCDRKLVGTPGRVG